MSDKYVDKSSVKIAHIGDGRIVDRLDVMFKISSQLKAITSRVLATPKSMLVDSVFTVREGNNIVYVPTTAECLVAGRLPVTAVDIMLVFHQERGVGIEELTVVIHLANGYLEILGSKAVVLDLCSWLNTPITALIK